MLGKSSILRHFTADICFDVCATNICQRRTGNMIDYLQIDFVSPVSERNPFTLLSKRTFAKKISHVPITFRQYFVSSFKFMWGNVVKIQFMFTKYVIDK